MPGDHWRPPRPETLYLVWQIGWAVAGAALLWRYRRTLKKDTDGRVGWSGKPSGVIAFFAIYIVAFLPLAGVSGKIAEEAARHVADIPAFKQAVFIFVNPALMAGLLLLLRRYTPEFSPGRPHRVKPTGDFGFTPAGLLRGFAGAMGLVAGTGFVWGLTLYAVKSAGWGDFSEKQSSVMLLAANSEPLVVIPFLTGVAVFAPVHEELFYRAGLFSLLRQWLPRVAAYAVCGLIFGAVHGNVAGFLPLAALGAWLAFLYDSTADLRVPVIIHALFNLSTVVWLLLAPGAAAM